MTANRIGPKDPFYNSSKKNQPHSKKFHEQMKKLRQTGEIDPDLAQAKQEQEQQNLEDLKTGKSDLARRGPIKELASPFEPNFQKELEQTKGGPKGVSENVGKPIPSPSYSQPPHVSKPLAKELKKETDLPRSDAFWGEVDLPDQPLPRELSLQERRRAERSQEPSSGKKEKGAPSPFDLVTKTAGKKEWKKEGPVSPSSERISSAYEETEEKDLPLPALRKETPLVVQKEGGKELVKSQSNSPFEEQLSPAIPSDKKKSKASGSVDHSFMQQTSEKPAVKDGKRESESKNRQSEIKEAIQPKNRQSEIKEAVQPKNQRSETKEAVQPPFAPESGKTEQLSNKPRHGYSGEKAGELGSSEEEKQSPAQSRRRSEQKAIPENQESFSPSPPFFQSRGRKSDRSLDEISTDDSSPSTWKSEEEEEKIIVKSNLNEKKEASRESALFESREAPFGQRDKRDRRSHSQTELVQPALPHFPSAIQPIAQAAAVQASPYLSSETLPLFYQMVGTIQIEVQKTGITKTEVLLNSPAFSRSIFYGTTITIEKYATAPDSLNIRLSGNNEAVQAFNQSIPSLMSAFQRGNFSFRINRIDVEYSSEKPTIRRKEGASGGEEDHGDFEGTTK